MILCDKPAGASSHAVVAAVRRAHGGVRAGHAGTLDPFATGLLVVLLGRATRAQRFFMALPKAYAAVARFGATSTTGDPEGQIVETGRPAPDPLVLPTGTLRQRPPAYSAVKVAGERAYRRARRGEAVEPAEREVRVERFAERWRDGDRVGLEIECSSGTYVRSLVADLGDAYCEELRRTAVGPFTVDEADDQTIIPLDAALGRFLGERRLEGEVARRATHGGAVPGSADGPVRLTDAQGLIAVAVPRPGGGPGVPGSDALHPVVGFRG